VLGIHVRVAWRIEPAEGMSSAVIPTAAHQERLITPRALHLCVVSDFRVSRHGTTTPTFAKQWNEGVGPHMASLSGKTRRVDNRHGLTQDWGASAGQNFPRERHGAPKGRGQQPLRVGI
jgi:hypothetical protein